MTDWFLHPERLWLILVVVGLAALYVGLQFTSPRYAVRFSNLELLDSVAPRRPGWRRHAVAGCFLVAAAVLVAAFAQPVMTEKVPSERSTIVLAIDTSLSMAATDVSPNRIEAAQAAAKEFIDKLPDQLNVGLISFAGSAQLLVPPTQDHAKVNAAIDGLELDKSTAIGDATKLAVQVIEDQARGTDGKKVDGAVVIMSDGETTVGLPTADAIPIAKKAGVAITTIAYGTQEGEITVDTDGDGVGQRTRVPVNVEELRSLAEGTGGTAYTAETAQSLRSVYSELGSTIGYDEKSQDVTYRFVGLSLVLLLVAAGFSLRWFSRLP
ncbi:MAG TPA: VWA domain-containing protein [Microthrixaceae bacterium]|mgnify:CR=1 FL=1|nr:VWA domain-containing protein [Microthrixaceae bacterium]